jgi:ElaB/YqjD/DUF883 family membrane-anchored ribosome-binding protein
MTTDQEWGVEMPGDAETERADGVPPCDTEKPIETDGLGQVREILLGPVSRNLRDRLEEVERRLEQVVRDLEQISGSRLEEMDRRFQGGLDEAGNKLDRQGEEQAQQSRLANEKVDGAVKELRETNGALRHEISEVKNEVLTTLFREVEACRKESELRATKVPDEVVDRATLSAVFSEAALRLSGGTKCGIDFDESDINLDNLIDSRSDETP